MLSCLYLVCLKFYVFTAKLDAENHIFPHIRMAVSLQKWVHLIKEKTSLKYLVLCLKYNWSTHLLQDTDFRHIYFLFTCFYHIDDAMQCYSCHDIKEKCFDPWNYDQFPKQTCPSRCFMCYVGKCLHLAIAKLCLPKTRKVSKSV